MDPMITKCCKIGGWGFIAAPGPALVIGIVCLAYLVYRGFHREDNGKISRANIASAVMLGASLYTMVVLILGQFFFEVPISTAVEHGFGNQRLAWLIVFMATDLAARFVGLFDQRARGPD